MDFLQKKGISKNMIIGFAGVLALYFLAIKPKLQKCQKLKQKIDQQNNNQTVIPDVDNSKIEQMNNIDDNPFDSEFQSKTTSKFIEGEFPVTRFNPPRRNERDGATFIESQQ